MDKVALVWKSLNIDTQKMNFIRRICYFFINYNLGNKISLSVNRNIATTIKN
jgi:hypothetical protein